MSWVSSLLKNIALKQNFIMLAAIILMLVVIPDSPANAQAANVVVSDTTNPRITSIVRQNPTTENTDADTLTWRVTFDEPVQNVNGGFGGDFAVTNAAGSTLTVNQVSPSVYDITIAGGTLPTLNDTVVLFVIGGNDITDLAGNALTNTAPTGANDNSFILSNTGPGIPEIAVIDGTNFINIFNNDNTPEVADSTDFGGHDVNGGQQDNSFLIFSDGTSQLDLNPGGLPVLISGDIADFTVITQPAQSIATGDFSTFTIRFNPTASGLRTATVMIPNNDPDEDPFTFSIQGTGLDTTAPRVLSIDTLFVGSPTDSDEIIWRIIFSETVNNLDLNDFTISGTTAPLSVRTGPVDNPGFGTLIDLRAIGGDLANLNGTVTLGFAPGQNIADVAGNPLTNFTPTGLDDRVVQIVNVDPDIRVTGNGTNPAINSGPDLVNGQTTTSAADGTDFGNQQVGTDSARFNYSVGNTIQFSTLTILDADVQITGTNAGDFRFSPSLGNRTLPGMSTTGFSVIFQPTATGVRQATISIGSNDPDENPFTFNVSGTGVAGPPDAVVATSGTPQTAAVGDPFGAPLIATVTDSTGNPIPGTNVFFTAPTSGASGTFASNGTNTEIVTTDANGMATSSVFTANATVGSYNVIATSGAAAPTDFALTNTAGTAAQLILVSGGPQTSSLNQQFAAPLIVRVVDAGGNPVPGVTVNFATPAGPGASATLSALNAVTDANGEAQVIATANGVGGNYNVTVSSAGLADVTFALTNQAGPTVEQTQAVIVDFLLNRANNILNTQPNLIDSVTGTGSGGGGPLGNLNVNGNEEGFTLAFTTSRSTILASQTNARLAQAFNGLEDADAASQAHSQTSAFATEDDVIGREGTYDLWLQVHGTQANSGTSDSSLWVGYVGAHTFVTDHMLFGILGQLDWSDEQNDAVNSDASGFGWAIGPYIAGQIPGQNLFYEARGAWGQSDNDVSPNGTFTDSFDTTRWLVSGKLSGAYEIDRLALKPTVSIAYYEEEQESYTDSIGQFIPEQTVSLGEVRFGPEISYHQELGDGTIVKPGLGVSGVWNFNVDDNNASQAFSLGSGDVRAKLDASLNIANPHDGMNIRINGFFDGIGASDFEAYGGSLELTVPLN
ncbi:MAG: choice-of-anchor D domain-containing protein [Pseudomonadota bacterium]